MSNVEDLLQQLEEAEDDNTSSHDTSVMYFLKKYNITEGEAFVGGQVLFKLYKATVPTSMNYNSFRSEIGQYLPFNHKGARINLEASIISGETVKLLSKKKRKSNTKGLKSFKHFIGINSIKSGNLWIEASLLYHLYKRSFTNRRAPLSAPEFAKFSDIHFKHTITDDVKWYGIDDGIYSTINKEEIEEIRNERREKIKEEKKTRRRKERDRKRKEDDKEVVTEA